MKVVKDMVRMDQEEDRLIREPLVRTKEEREAGVEPSVPVLETIRAFEWASSKWDLVADDDFAWLIPEAERVPNPYWAEAGAKHPGAKKDEKGDLGKMDLAFAVNLPGKGFYRTVAYVSESRAGEVRGKLEAGEGTFQALARQIQRMYPELLEG